MVQRGHHTALLEQLEQSHALTSFHGLHRHGVLHTLPQRAPVRARPQAALEDLPISTLRDLGSHAQFLHWHHEIAEDGVLQRAYAPAAANGVLPAVQLQKAFQGPPHHVPLRSRGESEALVELRVGQVDELIGAPQLLPLHADHCRLAKAQAADEGGELILIPEHWTYKWPRRPTRPTTPAALLGLPAPGTGVGRGWHCPACPSLGVRQCGRRAAAAA